MKKKYMKPEQREVVLQHRTMLLQASARNVRTNMDDDEDDFNWGGGSTDNAR